MLVGVESLEVSSELLDSGRCVFLELRKKNEVQNRSKSLHDIRCYLRVVSDDGYETCFEVPMFSTGVLTERRKTIREMAVLDVFLQTHVPTIDFVIAEELPRPLHNVLPEKFVPLMQGIGGKKR